ncbi:terminase small subunit [Neobacillus niacini]|uniref:terminase small subunit n=1 Tax=Neobacillus niacini TaxID=86668 RepID=UPI003000036B
MKLTEKQKRFADYYIETGNGAESARRAGYKGSNHDNIATENLRKLAIKKYIEDRIAEKDKQRIASQDEVLEFLTGVMRGEETETVPIFAKDHFEMIDNTPSIKDRTKAAELIGKRYKLWIEKKEIEGGLSPVVIVRGDPNAKRN